MAEFLYSRSEDLWWKAVASLKPELRELFSDEGVDKRGALEVLLYQARRQREVCIRKQWRITKKSGDVIILRDVFEKIIQCVDKFKMLGNAAAEFAPGYASVPWAVIKMLLQTGINDTTAFAAMIDGVEEVTSIIARFAIFEAVCMKHTTSATEHLKVSLVSLYAAVLSFLGTCCQYFSTNTGKRFMKATFDPAKEIEDALKRVNSKQKEVERTAQIANMEIMYGTSARVHDLTAMVSSLSAQLETANASIANLSINATNGEATTSSERADSVKVAIASIMGPTTRTIERLKPFHDHLLVEERQQVFGWLSSLRYASHHLTEAKGRLRNSGEWLFQKSEFLSWMNSSISGTLWVHGMPGCGKSKLASAVIDLHLTQAAEQGPMAAPVAYFYCARNSAEAGRSDPDQVLRCIARQLCGDDPKEIVNEDLLHKWEHVGKPRIGQGQLNIESIMGLILKTLADNPATIIIDALDELRADRRHEIFEYLDQIVKQSPNVVKVLLTSRNDGDIVCRLDTTPNVYISAQENRGDIERFIDAELDKAITQKRLLRGHVSADVQRQITFELNHRADGMFRWVSLQIQNLCDPQRMKLEEDVLHELRHLPQSLSDLYKIAFDQICQLGPWSYEMAMGALQLLLVAGRPIAWPEILHILQVSHSIIQRPISREELLDITCNFIDDDGKQECPRFAHQSVREYLETRPDFANAEANVAYMCLRQIAAPNEANTSDFQYPTLYLCDHLAATVPEQRVTLRPLLQELFRPPASGGEGKQSNLFKQWRSRLITFGGNGSLCVRKTDSVGNRIQATMTASPLNVICAVGLDDILSMLKPSRSDIFGGHRGRNCFMLAILLDQPRIVKAVRNLGFSVDTPSATGGTALSLAAKLGKASLIRELLVCGANPNQICQISDKSCTAAEEDSEPTVQSNNRRPQTSLGFHVSRNGRREIQSPFHYKEEKKPVLYVAMSNENAAKCVGALCEFGANVNTRTSSNTTALQNCLEYGNLRVMFQVFGILLKAGADASALLESERTIAHVVAAMGHCELIRQLLDIGADCSSRDVFQQSPLELAIRYGHTETAELLESKYGPPGPRKTSPLLKGQIVLSSSSNLSVPSISVQDYGSSSQPPASTNLDSPQPSVQPSELQFTSSESFEWNQIILAEAPKKSSYRRSISNLFKKMKSGSQ